MIILLLLLLAACIATPFSAEVTVPMAISFETDTLVPTDISRHDWQVNGASGASLKCTPAAVAMTVDGMVITNTVHLNPIASAGNQAERGYHVVATHSGPGTFYVPMKYAPGLAVGRPAIYIRNSSGTIIASTLCSLTSTGTMYTVTTAVVEGEEYKVGITCYDDSLGVLQNSQALVGPVRFHIAGGTGIFADRYVRISADRGTILDTAWTEDKARYTYFSEGARLAVDTDARAVRIEYYSTHSDLEFGAGGVFVGPPGSRMVDPWYQVQSLTLNRVAISEEILVPARLKRLEYWQAPQSASLGMFVRAMYLPADAWTILAQRQAGRTLYVLTDSIGSGSTSPQSWAIARGFIYHMRREFPGNVVFDGWGGRSLRGDGYNANDGVLSMEAGDIELRNDEIDRIGQNGTTTDFLSMEGTNDYTANETAADVEVAWQAFATDVHTHYPNMRTFWVTPFPRSLAEATPNAGGSTLAQMRTGQEDGIAAGILDVVTVYAPGVSVAPKATVISGPSILTLSDIGADLIHPLPVSTGIMVRGILSYFGDVY